MKAVSAIRWAIDQALWSFGVTRVSELLKLLQAYNVKDVAHQIQCPCLVMDSEDDMFFQGQARQLYDALTAAKKLVVFTKEDGAENHCQSGALAFTHQVVFDWLDGTLQSK